MLLYPSTVRLYLQDLKEIANAKLISNACALLVLVEVNLFMLQSGVDFLLSLVLFIN